MNRDELETCLDHVAQQWLVGGTIGLADVLSYFGLDKLAKASWAIAIDALESLATEYDCELAWDDDNDSCRIVRNDA